MNRVLAPRGVFFCLATFLPVAHAADEIPLRDFLRLADRDDFKISPDGKTLSSWRRTRIAATFFVQPVAGGEPRRVTWETARATTWLKTGPAYNRPFLDMLYQMVGHPVSDRALLEAVSPALHADRIRAPLFVAQGRNDERVKITESDQIVGALRKRGLEVDYLVKDNEGHGFASEENRLEFYAAVERFLARHLK